jgi:flagellar hook protein FlgE
LLPANGYSYWTKRYLPAQWAAENITFSIDFSGITQYAKETNVDMTYQNGYPAGTLTGITVDTTGVITGIFDNGRSWQLAQVAIANFDNPAGLIKVGQNMYSYSNNSGEPQIGESGTGGRGTIAPGYLEMSNVDLSEEFTQMIITQRGFASRIITASDEMQELK